MSKKEAKEYYCFKCKDPPINKMIRIKFVPDGAGGKRILDFDTGAAHVHASADATPAEPQKGDYVKTTCPKCSMDVMTILGQEGFYDNADCSASHQCQVIAEDPKKEISTTGGEEFKVIFTPASDLPDIPNFYRVTKIIVSREDNKWFSKDVSDKNYGKGTAQTDGYGKKPKVILEATVQTSDRLTIENVMEDLATIIRIHNKREMTQ